MQCISALADRDQFLRVDLMRFVFGVFSHTKQKQITSTKNYYLHQHSVDSEAVFNIPYRMLRAYGGCLGFKKR